MIKHMSIDGMILAGWVTLMNDFLPNLCFQEATRVCLSPDWISWLGVVTNLAAGMGALIVAR